MHDYLDEYKAIQLALYNTRKKLGLRLKTSDRKKVETLKGTNFTLPEIKEYISLVEQGYYAHEISLKMNKSTNAIEKCRQALSKRGVNLKRDKYHQREKRKKGL